MWKQESSVVIKTRKMGFLFASNHSADLKRTWADSMESLNMEKFLLSCLFMLTLYSAVISPRSSVIKSSNLIGYLSSPTRTAGRHTCTHMYTFGPVTVATAVRKRCRSTVHEGTGCQWMKQKTAAQRMRMGFSLISSWQEVICKTKTKGRSGCYTTTGTKQAKRMNSGDQATSVLQEGGWGSLLHQRREEK